MSGYAFCILLTLVAQAAGEIEHVGRSGKCKKMDSSAAQALQELFDDPGERENVSMHSREESLLGTSERAALPSARASASSEEKPLDSVSEQSRVARKAVLLEKLKKQDKLLRQLRKELQRKGNAVHEHQPGEHIELPVGEIQNETTTRMPEAVSQKNSSQGVGASAIPSAKASNTNVSFGELLQDKDSDSHHAGGKGWPPGGSNYGNPNYGGSNYGGFGGQQRAPASRGFNRTATSQAHMGMCEGSGKCDERDTCGMCAIACDSGRWHRTNDKQGQPCSQRGRPPTSCDFCDARYLNMEHEEQDRRNMANTDWHRYCGMVNPSTGQVVNQPCMWNQHHPGITCKAYEAFKKEQRGTQECIDSHGRLCTAAGGCSGCDCMVKDPSKPGYTSWANTDAYNQHKKRVEWGAQEVHGQQYENLGRQVLQKDVYKRF